MPSHPPQWTDFLQCSSCEKEFDLLYAVPISLICGHTVCKCCFATVSQNGCRYDQNCLPNNDEERQVELPPNFALLKIIAHQNNRPFNCKSIGDLKQSAGLFLGRDYHALYINCSNLLESLSVYLQDIKDGILPKSIELTKPMLRKLVSLLQCQIAVSEGRAKALRACRAIGERISTELILAHQNPATLSGNLWTAVRARGCQFLGPAMQEEALRLILLALEDGSELSRKVLVMFVVQRLQLQFPQASKTSIGHIVQLLYRASCFVVKKRDNDSSLMKLKESFRTYLALRREHDAQVVQIAREAGLRIAPDQWSALLYGDQSHKSNMQSIIDRLQSTETLSRCVQDLKNALEKSNNLSLKSMISQFEVLAQSEEIHSQSGQGDALVMNDDWEKLYKCLHSVQIIIKEVIVFSKNHSSELWRDEESLAQNAKFKTSFCRDIKSKGRCPRGASCTFAHTEDELHLFRMKRKKGALAAAGSRGSAQRSKSVSDSPNESQVDDHSSPPSSSRNQTVPMPDQSYSIQTDQRQEDPPNYDSKTIPQNNSPNPKLTNPHQPPQIPVVVQVNQPPPPPRPYSHPFSLNPNYLPPPSTPHYMPRNAVVGHTDSSNQNYQGIGGQQHNFTVTLSFCATPDHQNVQLSDAKIREVGLSPSPNVIAQFPPPDHTGPLVQNQPNIPSNIPHNSIPQQIHGTYPFNPPPPDNAQVIHQQAYRPYLPGQPVHQSPSYAPAVGYIPPQPVVQPQTPVYDPSFPQQMGHDIGRPLVLAPSPANQPIIMPMAPMQPYQAYDQSVSPQMIPQMMPIVPQPSSLVHSGAIFCIREQDGATSNRKLGIAKSIEHASVEELNRRKMEILQKMIQNQKKSPAQENTEDNYYDVWRCKSYSPLLTLGNAPTVPEILSEECGNNTVNVTAEIDTVTKQVTVRGEHHINPSHARNKRALDDKKMHQILVEKNIERYIEASTAAAWSSRPPVTLYTQGKKLVAMDDDIIPFSDRPTVSKYGPIARSIRTRPISADLVQVNATAETSTHPVPAFNEITKSSESYAYSSFENYHAVSCFPMSSPSCQSSAIISESVSSSSHSSSENPTSLSQAASNSQLLRREQVALQQNKAQAENQDLELVAELQQIELGLRHKKQHK